MTRRTLLSLPLATIAAQSAKKPQGGIRKAIESAKAHLDFQDSHPVPLMMIWMRDHCYLHDYCLHYKETSNWTTAGRLIDRVQVATSMLAFTNL